MQAEAAHSLTSPYEHEFERPAILHHASGAWIAFLGIDIYRNGYVSNSKAASRAVLSTRCSRADPSQDLVQFAHSARNAELIGHEDDDLWDVVSRRKLH
jgi:hypothetical protein